MVNGLSLFFGSLIGIVSLLGVVDATREERDPRLVLAAGLGLLVAASTRNLLWIYVGFEGFWFASRALAPLGALSVVSSGVSLVGVLVVAASTRTTDLALVGLDLEPSATVLVGVLLCLAGVVMKWLQSHEDPFLSLGAAVAVVSVLVRVSAWAPGIADALANVTWFTAAVAVAIGGVGSALSGSTRALGFWLTVLTVGLASFGLPGGAPVLPHVLLHVTASVVMLALVASGAPPLATWLAMLSLASMPPLPGFISKLNLLAALPPWAWMVALVGLLFAALGCMRELGRVGRVDRAWVTLTAIAAVIVLGLFPETILGAAMRAAAGLF